MPALIESSRTSITSSSTTSRSSSTSGIGQRPATPSAIVSMRSVSTTVPLTPRQRHRGRADGLDADHLHVLGERARDVGDAAGHRSAAERHEHDVELRIVADELEADRGGALAGRQVQAVLDQVGAVRLGDLARQQPGVLDVLAVEPHVRAEGGDLAQLERVRGPRRHDGDLQASARAAVGQRLPEVPGARAHHARRPLLARRGGHRLRAAPLEAPDRVERLDLQRHRAPERPAERRARQRGRVEERRIDLADRGADPIEPEPNTHGREHLTASGPGSRRRRRCSRP